MGAKSGILPTSSAQGVVLDPIRDPGSPYWHLKPKRAPKHQSAKVSDVTTVTCTIGVGLFPAHALSAHGLYAKLLHALYPSRLITLASILRRIKRSHLANVQNLADCRSPLSGRYLKRTNKALRLQSRKIKGMKLDQIDLLRPNIRQKRSRLICGYLYE